MSDSQSKTTRHADTVGLLLFSLGAFFAVLAVMALYKGVPEEGAGGTMVLAKALADAVGPLPGLALAAGLATLGAFLFLGAGVRDPLRHGAGIVGLALGFAVMLGAVQPGSGGAVGGATGGALTTALHPVAGFLAGLLALAVPLWLAWGRSLAWRFERPDRSAVAGEEKDGVTAAEAAALVPSRVVAKTVAASRAAAGTGGHDPEEAPEESAPPPPPYPEDVRRKGAVPDGTRPLKGEEKTADDGADEGTEGGASTVRRWTPKDAVERGQPADADLARGEPAEKPARRKLVVRGLGTPEGVRPLDAPPLPEPEAPAPLPARKIHAPGVRPIGPDGSPLDERGEVRAIESKTAVPPRPSWETAEEPRTAEPAEAESETGPERPEPVDAYGTPLSVRQAQGSAGEGLSVVAEDPGPEAAAPAAVEDASEEEDEELEYAEEDADEDEPRAEAEDEEEEDEEYEYEDEEEEEEDEEGEYEDTDEDEPRAEEEDEEYAEDEEYDDEGEEEEEYEDEDEDDEEYEYEDEGEDVEPEDELDPEVAAELLEVDEEEDAEVEPEDLFDVAARAEEPEEAAALSSDLSEESAGTPETAAEAEPESAPEPAPAPPAAKRAPAPEPAAAAEPEVVLTPKAPPAREPAASAPASPDDPDLIFAAGRLFLEEQRVTVSMLQRKFRLDFDGACIVLDRLQEMGLIGPYLGGQQRDILMTLDEWMERVTSPS